MKNQNKNQNKKQINNIGISINKFLLSSVSCLSAIETTNTSIQKGGLISDNFSTYYLDENIGGIYR